MPGWYLVISGAVALLVLAGVVYRALTDGRRRDAYAAAGAEFDPAYTDAPTRREAEEARDPVVERGELIGRGR